MRVVFLDIDGVLNAASEDDAPIVGELWSADWLDREMLERLSDLTRRGHADVVVSSSWRQRRSLAELDGILAAAGFTGRVVDVTPRLPRPPSGERFVRMEEVRSWLASRKDIESFVILDDDQDFGELSARHVRTDSQVGLTAADVERALGVLAG